MTQLERSSAVSAWNWSTGGFSGHLIVNREDENDRGELSNGVAAAALSVSSGTSNSDLFGTKIGMVIGKDLAGQNNSDADSSQTEESYSPWKEEWFYKAASESEGALRGSACLDQTHISKQGAWSLAAIALAVAICTTHQSLSLRASIRDKFSAQSFLDPREKDEISSWFSPSDKLVPLATAAASVASRDVELPTAADLYATIDEETFAWLKNLRVADKSPSQAYEVAEQIFNETVRAEVAV